MSDAFEGRLVDDVRRATWRLVGLLGLALVAAVAGTAVVLRADGDAATLIEATRAARVLHEAMLTEHSAVRGFVLSGEQRLLETYDAGHDEFDDASSELAENLAGRSEMSGLMADARTAAAAWQEHIHAVTDESVPVSGPEVDAWVLEGDALFARYDAAAERLIAAVNTGRDDLVDRSRTLLLAVGALQAGLLGGVVVAALRHRRRLVLGVAEPVARIHEVIVAMAGGDLGARAPVEGFTEVKEAAAGLAGLGNAFSDEQVRAQLRGDLLATRGDRFRELLDTSREISGNLSLRYVTEAITGAARRFTGWPNAQLRLTGDGDFPASLEEVVRSGIPEHRPGRVALPLVVGRRVIGVLECWGEHGETVRRPDVEEILGVLAAHAATAVEAARLHSRLEHDSRVDPLTGLGNRRSFAADLDAELLRFRRYGCPLSLLMADLDHFKAVNDTHGHPTGDAVLQDVAELLSRQLRASDTAYRYGGEELVILLRETDLSSATDVAERLRSSIEQHSTAGIVVTVSIGCAEIGAGDDSEAVIARADRALYDAKTAGRNTVRPAPP